MHSLRSRLLLTALPVVLPVALLAGCSDNDDNFPPPVTTDTGTDATADTTSDAELDTALPDTGTDSGTDTKADADTGVGGDVPEAYFGVWAGNGLSYPDFTYPMIHVLTPGDKGEVIGWSSYPTYPCGGRLKLDNVTTSSAGDAGPADAMVVGDAAVTLPNGVQVTEVLEYGKDLCGDGAKQSFALRSDGKINWSWLSTSYFDTGELTRVGAPGADVPRAYWGVWRGSWTETTASSDAGTGDSGVTALKNDNFFVALTLGQKGQTIGAFVYEDSKCTGRWNLTDTGSTLKITEQLLRGTCEDGATITLGTSGSSLTYTWAKGGRTLTGTLTRVSP